MFAFQYGQEPNGLGNKMKESCSMSQQASQDTLSRTDEEDEENDSVSMPSVVSEQEAYLYGFHWEEAILQSSLQHVRDSG
uniref:Uncharacterized protein n=1 Tax=Sphaerodactylus townsendi TaxID=933632 RepID=A0ACB8FZR8_9SAUR